MELSAWQREVPFGAYLQPIHLTILGPGGSVSVVPGAARAAAETDALPITDAPDPAAAAVPLREPNGAIHETDGGDPTARAPQADAGAGAVADTSSTDSSASTATAAPTATAAAAVQEPSDVQLTPKRLKRRQKPAPPTPKALASALCEQDLKVILPFESELIQSSSSNSNDSSDRMALNVGGPVWALDWLPPARRRKRKPAASAKKKAAASTAAAAAAVSSTNSTAANGEKEYRDENEIENGGGESESGREDDSPSHAARDKVAREWRFLALSTHPPCEVIDGELVKKTPPDHYYNPDESGARGLIQIWAVPVHKKTKAVETTVSKASSKTKGKATPALAAPDAPAPAAPAAPAASADDRKPKLVYGIDHCSGVAWDLQWCPVVATMSKRVRSKNLLGVLAVCFGDGSLQIFEVPAVAPELLTTQGLAKHETRVEKLKPSIHARVPKIIQLSVQWSPHRWNLILTGGSDGSVSLWNLEWELSKADGDERDGSSPAPAMEPQRRFHDVDAVGKQEAFDWGWGWVAVRSVSWSPFDEFIFATTGNDSIFKVWDIREPRICFRSHRIRSTWGLALQWMDHATIHISGDQGSIYMYDILSGSYQKLHYHPQIDSPVWDLQFARRDGDAPLLVSCCTSGSIRVAPAKKLFRAPQHSIEFCRVSGESSASVEREFKALTVDFSHRVVSGTAESSSPATRQFCERDAALHRLRMSTSASGVYPCFLAAGGHAGLVVILEIQESLDHLLENYFVPAHRRLGRSRRGNVGPWSASKKKKKKAQKKKTQLVIDSGKKVRAGGKKQQLVTPKKSAKKKANGSAAVEEGENESEFPQFELKSGSDDEEEEEYDDEEEEEDSDAGLALMLAEEHSDDDRASYDMEEDEEMLGVSGGSGMQYNPESARMMSEYQLDLSEEDAIMLAIQMSELEQVRSSPPPKSHPAKAKAKSKVTASPAAKTPAETPAKAKASVQSSPAKSSAGSQADNGGAPRSATKPKNQEQSEKKKSPAKSSSAQKKPQPQQKGKQLKKTSEAAVPPAAVKDSATKVTPPSKTPSQKSKAKGAAAVSTASSAAVAAKPPTDKKAAQAKKKAGSGRASSNAAPDTAMLDGFEGYIMDQAATLQIIQFQNGMSEEDALMEAIRMSEVEAKRAAEPENEAAEGGGEAMDVDSSTASATANDTPLDGDVTTAVTAEGKESGSIQEISAAEQAVAAAAEAESGGETDALAVRRLESTSVAKSNVDTAPDATDVADSVSHAASAPAAAGGERSSPKTTAPVEPTAAAERAGDAPVAAITAAETSASEQPAADLPDESSTKSLEPKLKLRAASAGNSNAAPAPAPATSESPAAAEGSVALPSSENTVAPVVSASAGVDASATVVVTAAGATGDSATEEAVAAEMIAGATPAAATPAAAPKPKAKAASSSSAAKRKRAPPKKPAQARKRPAVKPSSSSRAQGAASGGNQEESGYLTDEEALYLALRASEVEY